MKGVTSERRDVTGGGGAWRSARMGRGEEGGGGEGGVS